MLELGRVVEPFPETSKDVEASRAARRREQDVGLMKVEKQAQEAVANLDNIPEVAALGGG